MRYPRKHWSNAVGVASIAVTKWVQYARTPFVLWLLSILVASGMSCSETSGVSEYSPTPASVASSKGLADVIDFLNSREVFDPPDGSWGGAIIPAEGRVGHTATQLRNGEFLVVGGWDQNFTTQSLVERYNPVMLSDWNSTRFMTDARTGHTATLLADGNVLVTGGLKSQDYVLDTAEVYAPGTERWSSAGHMGAARVGHTATLLDSGKVLVIGGWGSSLNRLASAEIYDPSLNTWSPTGDMAVARAGHTATLLAEGVVRVKGGETKTTSPSTEEYDPTTGAWSTIECPP